MEGGFYSLKGQGFCAEKYFIGFLDCKEMAFQLAHISPKEKKEHICSAVTMVQVMMI